MANGRQQRQLLQTDSFKRGIASNNGLPPYMNVTDPVGPNLWNAPLCNNETSQLKASLCTSNSYSEDYDGENILEGCAAAVDS
ncbi:hypothetical protein TNCV_867191 [Trichonephila clavipes]|nr:hypothetical protein TNCV_867191 [Trichonephila clavipes]